jgi:hypothetical protein
LYYHFGGHDGQETDQAWQQSGALIDRGILDLLDIGPDTPLTIKTDGKRLIVTLTQDARRKKFRTALTKVNQQYGPALRKLAE